MGCDNCTKCHKIIHPMTPSHRMIGVTETRHALSLQRIAIFMEEISRKSPPLVDNYIIEEKPYSNISDMQ